ncbi:carboxypeptidase-like regulatory domain-containing protein [Seonamhaeicola sp.]|uniref:carboxypeptidase-like regulatory domain-containing protein n=1 Tax=Seonamhaeicola sp. TaxID=1912245 RepID=UPI002620126A|nr:carboxypeptidase-like regulatory domain-containing protein [Seonamhaeicola sp.]
MKILMTILMLTSFLCVKAQDLTLKGRIISEDLEALPEAKIYSNKDELLGTTDIEGKFEISIPNDVLTLYISYVGMEHTVIELSDDCNVLEVIVMIDAIYDFMSQKRVDRLRKKRFKKLPKLHKEAFEKGLFKTDKACYTQKFTPYSKKKQK